MACINRGPNGTRTIQFVAGDGKRRSIRLGKVSSKMAEAIKVRVETLNVAAISKCPLDGDTAAWVAGIGDDLADRLAAVGLIPGRASARLGEFLDSYIVGRTDVKDSSRVCMEQARRRLLDFLPADKNLRDITPADADGFLRYLRGRFADATAGRTAKWAKSFFRAAHRARLVPDNPFADLKKLGSQTNKERQHFVTREVAYKVLDACPDAEWRLIFALSRFGGLRCPSEHLALEWTEVDWARGRFLVHAPKTEHHEGKAERWVPIFPELRPYLEEAFELAPEGAKYVITSKRDATQNLRTRLFKIIRRAGVQPWPKLFQNLRASRETELAAEYPLHVVCAWIGNTPSIAANHYLQVTDADFERAAGSGAKSGAVAVQKAVQSAADRGGQYYATGREVFENRELSRVLSNVVSYMQYSQVGTEGLEPPTPSV